MRSRMQRGWWLLSLGLVVLPAVAAAQEVDTTGFFTPVSSEPPVLQHNLSGPRLGATFGSQGMPRSQFGWHFEHQAAPGSRGPWFIVERVLLIGGMESNAFYPSGTLIFGMRLPSSAEFGVGPSLTLGGPRGVGTAVVIAAGRSFRTGGVRIPVNLAVALQTAGPARVSLMTGWAIRESAR